MSTTKVVIFERFPNQSTKNCWLPIIVLWIKTTTCIPIKKVVYSNGIDDCTKMSTIRVELLFNQLQINWLIFGNLYTNYINAFRQIVFQDPFGLLQFSIMLCFEQFSS